MKLPIDAVPDMTNTQVTVITEAGSLSPVEVERYITNPVESVMGGLPQLEELRSVSKFGISVVTIVFQEDTDLYWARQLVNERIPQAAEMIPASYGTPKIGPLTTALGEILQFEVRGANYTPTELRSILDWEIAPKLRGVQGVTEINTHGGYYKTYEVQPILSAWPAPALRSKISIRRSSKTIVLPAVAMLLNTTSSSSYGAGNPQLTRRTASSCAAPRAERHACARARCG